MPFTISHVAASLPFHKKQTKLFFPAIAIGTMAPDFEYFLRGRMFGIYGHTVIGAFALDVPLPMLVYLLGSLFILPTLMPYLPQTFQFNQKRHNIRSPGFWSTFIISSLLGIVSHIIWDSFTHATGFMVRHIPGLSIKLNLFGISLPFYKVLQHGSSILGLLIVASYVLYYKHTNKVTVPSVSAKRKVLTWTGTAFFAVILFAVWYLIMPISFNNYGSLVVRLIDSGCVSVIVLTALLKIQTKD